MTTQDYTNKAKELTSKYNTNITVGTLWNNEPCLVLNNCDKARTLQEMKVAKGFNIGFESFGNVMSA